MKIEKHIFKSKSFKEFIDEAIGFFIKTPVESLSLSERFAGPGVYAIYYSGEFELYKKLYGNNKSLPIYVGKAVLPGWRQGRVHVKQNDAALYRRLAEHGRSITAAENLNLVDFSCRFIVLAAEQLDLIGTVEAALIRKYNPLWNSQIDGFGNHDPGKGRYEQAKSEWDVLHPGREWAAKLKGIPVDYGKIAEKIGKYDVK